MEHYVYILQSTVTKEFYRGMTNDLERRLKEHNNREEKYTRNGVPWNLVWWTIKSTRSEAMVLERKLKNLGSQERILKFIRKYPCVGGKDVPPVVEVLMKTKP